MRFLMLGLLIERLVVGLVESIARRIVMLVSLLQKQTAVPVVYSGMPTEKLVLRPRKHFETLPVLVDRSCCYLVDVIVQSATLDLG